MVSSPVIEARKKTGLSQSQFAALLGVSMRTLQGWEQGRKQSSGAARTLLAVASTDQSEIVVRDLDLDVLREVRNAWQFYRDRRPESYRATGAP